MPFAFPLVRRSRLVTLAGQLQQQADRIAAIESDKDRLGDLAAERYRRTMGLESDVETLKGHLRGACAERDYLNNLAYCGEAPWRSVAAERLETIKALDAEVDRLRESDARYRAFCDGLRDALNDGLDAPDHD